MIIVTGIGDFYQFKLLPLKFITDLQRIFSVKSRKVELCNKNKADNENYRVSALVASTGIEPVFKV